MPIYEYVCCQCANEFELLVRGEEKAECPNCSSLKLEKQFSVTASPQSQNGTLPIANPGVAPNAGSCGAPRCCGGGCQL